MQALTIKTENLPTDPLKLAGILYDGKEKFNNLRAAVKLLKNQKKLGDKYYDFLKKSQNAAIKLLEIQAKIGKISFETEQAHTAPRKINRDKKGKIISCENYKTGDAPKYKKLGLKSIYDLRLCQAVYRNLDVTEKVIQNAIKGKDVPTAEQVRSHMNKTKYKPSGLTKEDKISKRMKELELDILSFGENVSENFIDETKKSLENISKKIDDMKMVKDYKENEPPEVIESMVKRLI